MRWLPRALGAATAVYGITTYVKPELMLRPAGLLRGRSAEDEQKVFTRVISVRDTASGLAMVFAKGRKAQRVAIAVRVASDIGDLVVLGRATRGKPEWRNVIAITSGWAALCALSGLAVRRR